MPTRTPREPASSDARTAAAIAELQVEVEKLREDINHIETKLDQILEKEKADLRRLADMIEANSRWITETSAQRKGLMAIAAGAGAILMAFAEKIWDFFFGTTPPAAP